jgi:SAM-dependent methyltransferase
MDKDQWTQHIGIASDYLEGGTSAATVKAMLNDSANLSRIMADRRPLPPRNQRIHYYGDDHLGYWLSGLKDVQTLRNLAGTAIEGPILDFGSSSGRVARHWAMEPEGYEVHACDVTGRMIEWLNAHLAPQVIGHATNINPPLPFEDRYFGFAYAFSVFSHIYEGEESWLEELHRVARPGATVILTIHNDHTWDVLPTTTFRIGLMMQQIKQYRDLRDAGSAMPDRLGLEHGGVSYAFYSNDHIRRVWARWFDVIDIVGAAHNYQAAVVLRRRAD